MVLGEGCEEAMVGPSGRRLCGWFGVSIEMHVFRGLVCVRCWAALGGNWEAKVPGFRSLGVRVRIRKAHFGSS